MNTDRKPNGDNDFKFFDFEVFPNWWCVVVSDEEDTYPGGMYNNAFTKEDENRIKDKMRIYTSDDIKTREDVEMLKREFKEGVLCGYNIKGYDLNILKAVLNGATPQTVYKVNELLLSKFDPEILLKKYGKDFYKDGYSRIASAYRYGWRETEYGWQDLMDDTNEKKGITGGGSKVGGLKDKEASLGMDIRETTVPFGKEDLTEQEKDEILFYCKHDVYALHVYYVAVKKSYIDTKIVLCKTFGFTKRDGYRSTNAVLAAEALGAEHVHGTEIKDPTITVHNKEHREYFERYVPKDIYQHLLTSIDNRKFDVFDNELVIANGGLHSTYKLPTIRGEKSAIYVESTDEYTMLNVDASSCYTSVMIFMDCMSRAIKQPEKLKQIYDRRVKLKFTPKSQWSKEDAAFVAAAKLIMNTASGAQGQKFSKLYDDYMRSKMCRVGQMLMIALAGQLYEEIPNLKIIQTNTDGILVYIKREYIPQVNKIVDDLQKLTHFIFETEEDNKLWQLNVNNYIAIHPDGEIKDKGGAFVTSIFQPGYNHCRPLSYYCVPRAQKDFYTSVNTDNVVNPLKNILDNTTVADFVVTCTKGPGYRNMVQYNTDGEVELGKVARVIAVKNESLGIIKKIKVIQKETKTKHVGDIQADSVALCPPHPLVVNDALENYKIENRKLIHIPTGDTYDIDYMYYAAELDKALDIVWYKMKNDTFGITKEFNL